MKTSRAILGCLAPLLLTLAACSSAPEASDRETEGRVSVDGETCKTGKEIEFPQFRLSDYTYFTKPDATVTIPFDGRAQRLGLGHAVDHAFSIIVKDGPATHSIVSEDMTVCGETLMLPANPRLAFWGDSLSECAASQPTSSCPLLARLCVPGTYQEETESPNCVLKPGITLEAQIFPKEERCDVGFGFSGWNEPKTEPIARSEVKTHTPAGYTLNANIALDSDVHQVRIYNDGGLPLTDNSWEACGSTITVKPHARVLLGESSEVAEYYCVPGTGQGHAGTDEASCELKLGFQMTAETFIADYSNAPNE